MIAVSNNWAVIWVYYVFYHATQALAVARGQERLDSHPKTQNAFAQHWFEQKCPVAPWGFGVNATGYHNMPSSTNIIPIHGWKPCNASSCWSLMAKALDTTRRDKLAELIREERERRQKSGKRAWEQEEAARRAAGRRARKVPHFSLPLLLAADKASINAKCRATTIMDYLYRLRIRSNYVDTEMFTDGPRTPYTVAISPSQPPPNHSDDAPTA